MMCGIVFGMDWCCGGDGVIGIVDVFDFGWYGY